jgi:serine protease AprX
MSAELPRQGGLEKISPWVMQRTENGQESEFLVVLADQADLSAADALTSKNEKGRYVYQALFSKAQATQSEILSQLRERNIEYQSFYIVNMIKVRGDRSVALELAARPDVARVDSNMSFQQALPVLLPENRLQGNAPAGIEPNISYVNAPALWAKGFTGQGIVIGGQDTGYQWDHPALRSQYRGWNGAAANHDYNWHDSVHSGGGAVCGADAAAPCDDHGHGTHTMGTAVGSDGGSNTIGMAPGAKWIGCRNMNVGVGSPSTYAECLEFFLAPYPVGGNPSQGDPDKAPDVTVNSWGCPSSEGCAPDTLRLAFQAQRAAGIMTVASAGNSGPSCSTVTDPPSIYREVFSVGALQTGTDTIASFSSRGPVTVDGSGLRKPGISAPGTSVRSSIRGSSYGLMSGTSMAGPHVSGAVALLWSARPGLKNNISLTEKILTSSAVHISTSSCSSSGWPNNVYGFGRLDAEAAVFLSGFSAMFSDFDTDGLSDITVRHPSDGIWYSLSTRIPGTYTSTQWGLTSDVPVAGNYDGDRTTDIAVWRPSTGIWYILRSDTPGAYTSTQWGLAGDRPIPGDYDGDGKTDIAVQRPSSGVWYILPSDSPGTYTAIQWGLPDDIAVPADYDGDGKTDIAVWRPSSAIWYALPSRNPGSYTSIQWGLSDDLPVPGDYDGDGKTDIAVWRPGTGVWYWLSSASPGAYTAIQWGLPQDTPVSADYDGDGKADLSVWRSSEGIWYILKSGSPGSYAATPWGLPTDEAVSPLTGILRSIP